MLMSRESGRKKMSGGKYALFAVLVVIISTAALLATFLAGDLYFHYKLQAKGMYNIWGYRGSSVGPKKKGEFRIAVLGGSSALGYGTPLGHSFPANLERAFNKNPRRKGGPESYKIVNLAWNNEGAHSYIHTLKDYTYLDYDAVIIYTGYNDLGGKNLAVFRHKSPIFRLTGYLPLLPTMMLDKAKTLQFGLGIGEINLGKRRTNFTPSVMDQTKATALNIGGQIALSLEEQLGGLTNPGQIKIMAGDTDCGERWTFYCSEIKPALHFALNNGLPVAIVTQPYISDKHVEQQKTLVNMLRRRYGDNPRLLHINLGRAVDLKDRKLSFDGMHLTSRGNEIISKNLIAPLTRFFARAS
jgi:hypothetical protein